MSNGLRQLITDKRVIVCCGAGGVGKTSVACALALGAARAGRRVLAVTIDPSKRLAEALGVAQNCPEPVTLGDERLREAGITLPGNLDAWMLDPQAVSDNVVRRFSRSPEDAERLLENRIYRNVTQMVAGMQEYTAVEAMHGFVHDGRYDLVILDTPPSRNALHFLEAPNRITRFLDGRVFRFFLPGEDGLVQRAASKITARVMDFAFGQEHRIEMLSFFALFNVILKRLSRDAAELRDFFRQPDVAFLVITSPAHEALEEAAFFERKTRDDLSLHLAGYVLNRSLAHDDGRRFPDAEFFAGTGVSESAQAKLRVLAEREQRQRQVHTDLLVRLRARMGDGCFVQAAPYLRDGVSDIPTLRQLMEALL